MKEIKVKNVLHLTAKKSDKTGIKCAGGKMYKNKKFRFYINGKGLDNERILNYNMGG